MRLTEFEPVINEAAEALGLFKATAAKKAETFSHLFVVPNSESELASRLKDVRLVGAEERTFEHVPLTKLSIVGDGGEVKPATELFRQNPDLGHMSLSSRFVNPKDLVGEHGSTQRLQSLMSGDLNYTHEFRGADQVYVRSIGVYMPGGFRSFDDAMAAGRSQGIVPNGSNYFSENRVGEMAPLSTIFANPKTVFGKGPESSEFRTILHIGPTPGVGAGETKYMGQAILGGKPIEFDASKFGRIRSGPPVAEPDSFVGLGAMSNPNLIVSRGNERNAVAHGMTAFAEETARLKPQLGRNRENVARGIAQEMALDDVDYIHTSAQMAGNVDRVIEDGRLFAWQRALSEAAGLNPAVAKLPGWSSLGGREGVSLYSTGLAEGLNVSDIPLVSTRIAPQVGADRVTDIMRTFKSFEDPGEAQDAIVRLGISHAQTDASRYKGIVDSALMEGSNIPKA